MGTWTMPAELDQLLPRQVRRRSSFTILIVFQAVLFAFLLSVSGVALVSKYFDAETLKERGVRTSGTVTRLYTSSGSKGRTYYNIAYTFPLPSNLVFAATKQADNARYNEMQVNQTVPVVYDPLSPARSELNFGNVVYTRDNLKVLMVNSLVLVPTGLVAGGLTIFFVVLYRRQKWLLQWGKAAAATFVSDVEYNAGKSGRKAAVTYTFADESGGLQQGKRTGLPLKGSRTSAMYTEMFGDPTVIYDPNDSKKNMLYPFAWVDCVSRPESSLFSPP